MTGWLFDPANAHEFYVAKGVIGVAAVGLYLYHMSIVWHSLKNTAQQLRYLCLLYLAFLITSSSVEQVRDDALVNWRNVGGMVGIVLLLVTVIVSLALDKPRHQSSA